MSENQNRELKLKPRPFQIELLEKAMKRDVIIHLKTGSGKTFISVMLINNLSDQCELPYSKGGKRTIFLANTVPLVKQQSDYLRLHTHLKVGDYFGDKVIDQRVLDAWDEAIWKQELERHQVLVMTPQILVTMLAHSFIHMEKVNLIIFDECHHATGNHPYSQIMEKYKEIKKESNLNIRVLGLTASIVQKKCNLSQFNTQMKKLEDKFGCKVETASIIETTDENESKLEKPQIKVLIYDSTYEKSLPIYVSFGELKSEVAKYDGYYEKLRKEKKERIIETVDNPQFDETNLIFSSENENPFKLMKRVLSDLESLLEDMGVWTFSVALQDSIKELKQNKFSSSKPTEETEINEMIQKIEKFYENQVRKLLSQEDENNLNKILEYSSEKLNCLLDIYAQKCDQTNFHSIIFVERKTTAYYVDFVIKKLSQLDKWAFLKSDHLFSVAGVRNKMTLAKQDKILKKFRVHDINVLVATNILEEGVDVPACNMVIRFSKIFNFGSFVQSKGRARSKKSSYFIMRSLEEPDTELENFLEIERDLEENLVKKYDENDDYYYSQEDINYLKPYTKGKCQIACHQAISLINRYCASMEHNLCGVLYPIYCISTFRIQDQDVFTCSLRLPPNSVINQTIQSDRFPRKKLAKMDVALKMCEELDKAGELAENLTILSKEDWLNSHFNIKENLEEDRKLGKKVGSTKLKREYETKFAEAFLENHPRPNQECFLYAIKIKEEVFDSNYPFIKQMQDDIDIGFLSSKMIPTIPRFKLYRANSQFYITIVNTYKKVLLNDEQHETLKQYYKKVFKDTLKIKFELNFDDSPYGGLFALLKKDKFEIDWDTVRAMNLRDQTAYEIYKQNPNDFSKSYKDSVWSHRGMLVSIIDIKHNLNPLSQFPNKSFQIPNFKEYFKQKYQIDTLDNEQPLVEVQHQTRNLSFILRGTSEQMNKKVKQSNYPILLIMEHLENMSIPSSHLFKLSMLPCIFYRIECILRAQKLQSTIETEIKQSLKLNEIKNEKLVWDDSLKFHKVKQDLIKEDEIQNEEITEESSSDSEEDDILSRIINQIPKVNGLKVMQKRDLLNELDEIKTVPELLIKEKTENFLFPNTFNILQCLTLKSAIDNFDLERYEVLGDCFLKLTVVMKIYVDFAFTSEGKMASLKSARVSNNYLYKLAIKKNLNEFIVWQNFKPETTWIPPNLDRLKFIQDSKYKTKLADKSLADCVEALIGVYLIYLGTNAANAFIDWLDFKISDKLGKVNLVDVYKLPSPALVPRDENFVDILTARYAEFESFLGYEFKDKYYLLQAFTHPSDISNTFTSSYQKLELVGDAVLDILITQHIFQDKREHSPGELTELRQALVNNKFFAHLAVKHGFNKYFSHASIDISRKLNEYIREHSIYSPDVAYLGIKNNNDLETDDYEMETPKFLADIFESVAGAIYLDSNCDLKTVWNAYYKMLDPYLIAFKENIPCSPIQALLKLKPQAKIKLEVIKKESDDEKEFDEETSVQVNLKVDDKIFSGFGRNKTIAKTIAYKKAVREFDSYKSIIFF